MKPLVFLDTGAFYALADANDRDHVAVHSAYNDPGRTFILHEFILVEAFSLLTKRLYKQAALRTVGAFRFSSRVEKAPPDSGSARSGLGMLPTVCRQGMGLDRLREF